MGWKIFFSFLFILFAIILLVVYWFIPFNTIEFKKYENLGSNFSISASKEDTQFYLNMRYPDKRVSYRIYNCPLKKEDDMLKAFNLISDETILSFYSISSNEEISITCDSKNKFEGGMFIAGEGGPINITKINNFYVILSGKILLIRESNCEKPNIAIHELLHALGFDHSVNPNNIMYSISNCNQVIGQDTFDVINELYSVPPYPDLSFENVSAVMNGRYLDVNFSVRNNGLKKSSSALIKIYADDKKIKEIELDALEIGYGISIKLSNVFVNKLSVKQLRLFIESDFEELSRDNNEAILKIK